MNAPQQSSGGQQPAQAQAQQPSAPLTWGNNGGNTQATSVTHQHLADPTSGSRKGGAPASPYLIQHPGIAPQQPAAPAGQAPAEQAAPAAAPEPPAPPPLAGYSREVLKVMAENNLKALKKKASVVSNTNNITPPPSIAAPGATAATQPPGYMNWRRPEQGLFEGYNTASPFGLNNAQPSSSAMSGMLSAFGLSKEKNPWLYPAAEVGLKLGLGPLLQSKIDYTKHLGNPNSKFIQRMNTHKMFLEAGNNKISPLATIGASLIGKVFGGGAPDAETLSQGYDTAREAFGK